MLGFGITALLTWNCDYYYYFFFLFFAIVWVSFLLLPFLYLVGWWSFSFFRHGPLLFFSS